MNLESFAFLARPRLHAAGLIAEEVDEDYLQAVLGLCQPKARSLDSLGELCDYCFSDHFEMDAKQAEKLAKKGDPKAQLAELLPILEGVDSFSADGLHAALEAHATAQEQKVFAYFPVLRLAVSGRAGGPDLLPLLAVLGRKRVLDRVHAFIA